MRGNKGNSRFSIEIYNPKDCWHRPYFIEKNGELYVNDFGKEACALSESEYETLCKRHGVNPIYPPKFSIVG